MSDERDWRIATDLLHDLSQPVAAIAGWIQLVEDRYLHDEDIREELRSLSDQSMMLAEMIRDAMRLVRTGAVESGAPVELESLISEILEVVPQQGGEIDVTLETSALICRGPRSFVRRALQNPVFNAVRYARSAVRIRTRIVEDAVIVEIEDDGPGLSPREVEAAFHRPVREGEVRFGLGAARWAASHLGGTFEYAGASELGGARFVLTIPAGVRTGMVRR